MVALWWQQALRQGLPGRRTRSWLLLGARFLGAQAGVLMLIALAVTASCAQQPTSSSSQQTDHTAYQPEQHAPLSRSEMGQLPGALRQKADQRFLAERGISWQPGSTAPRDAAPAERMDRARVLQQQLLRAAALSAAVPATSATPGTWQSLGPAHVATSAYGEVTGRITSLAADPNDSSGNTLYLGATGGGVWKSTNAANPLPNVSFTPLTDALPAFSNYLASLSIGALTVQPTSSGVVLAGTGDPNDALDSYYGAGILRSTDGGVTWTLIRGSKDLTNPSGSGLQNYSFIGNGFAGFAWSTLSPSLVVAAVAQSAEGILVNAGSTANMEAGLYYSSDAGQTWYLAIVEDSATQIVQSPNKVGSPPGNSATSVIWNPVRKRFYAAVRFHGYYESLDGVTWTRLVNQPSSNLSTSACPTNAGGLGQTSCPIFRGALAVQPVTGDLFALTTDLNNLDQGLFQDVCSTNGLPVTSCASSTVTFANQIPSRALENGGGDTTIPLADYDLTLSAISSQQDTILFAGTEDIYRCSLANSCAWRNTTNIQTCAAALVAPSQHATESTFGRTGLVYFANDGGLWRSTDTVGQTGSVCASSDASHYQNLNSGIGSLAEIKHFTVDPGAASNLLAGMGSFGTVATTGTQGSWQQLLTGEGSYTAIDPANPQNWYTEAGSGVNIHRCTAGASCNAASFGTAATIGSSQVEDDADYFAEPAPWILDPLNSANLLLGTCRVWRGPATGGWSSSNLLSPMLDGNQQPFCNGNAELRSIGAGLNASASAGTEQMYAGMAGPYDGGGTTPGHIFTSTVPAGGGSTTWTDLYNSPVSNSSNNQFNTGGFAISSIAVDPHDATGHTLYATMQGFSGNGISDGEVYGSTDGGAHWLNLTNSLPLAPANGIVVDPNVPSTLYVALDTGVYYTQNVSACSDPTQTCWAVYGSGLPNAPVTSLQVYSAGASSILEASTYGRGIWALGLLTAPAQGTLSPASHTFASQQVATSGTVFAFTLANTGSAPMAIASIQASADYSQTNSCGASVAAGASCTIQVTFAPTAAGDRPGTLTLYANVGGGQLSSTLDGIGLAPGTLTPTPTSLMFPATIQGASAAPQSVSVQNTGGVAVQLQTFTVTTDYSISSNSCGSTLAPGASCMVSIGFTPRALGDRAGQLSMPSNVAGSPTIVSLDGSGVTPPMIALTPTSLAFSDTAQGSVSASKSIGLKNNGGATAQLQTPTIAGDYQITGNSCGSTLTPGATCVIQVAFAPAATGIRSGLLTIPASVSGGQVTAALTGKGINPAALTLSPVSLTFPSTATGATSAAKSIRLLSTGGVPVQLGTLTITGDYSISANPCTAALAPGASCTLQITFSPTATGDRPGLLTVPANVANSQLTAALDGTGVTPPALSLVPTLLTFSATAIGSTTVAQSIAVSNLGGAVAQLLTPTATGDFAVSSNNCGSSVAPGGHCTLQVTFTPTAAGTRTGTLTLAGSNFSVAPVDVRTADHSALAPDTSGQLTAALSGLGVAQPVVTFNPSPAPFDPQPRGSASPAKSITVTNTGAVAVLMQAPSINGNFYISGSTCPVSPAAFAAAATCVIQVYFHPATTGSLTGSLILNGNMSGGQITDLLSGIGLGSGALTLTPGSLAFGSLLINSTSAPMTVTASNTSDTALTLSSPNISGDYALAAGGTCGTTLAANSSCTLQLTFHPSAAGDRPGQLQQSDSAPGDDVQVVNLDGTGLNPGSVALTPAFFDFGSVAVGASSSSATLSANNSGDVAVHLQTPLLTGSSSADYSLVNRCGATLAANSACTLLVTFTPTSTGSRPATLTLASDAVNSPASATLTGNGVAAGNLSLAPASTSFPSTVVGATSATRAIIAANSGGVTVQLGAPAVPADYQITSTTCTGTLGAGHTCTLQVAFTPTAPGDRPGTLSFPGQFTGSPATAALDGTGIAAGALTLSPASLSFPSTITGTPSSPIPVTVTNSGGVAVQLGSPSAAGDYSVQAGGCPASLAPQSSCMLQVIFTPTAAGDRPGLLTVPGTIAGNQVTATLDGTGVLPGALSLSPPLVSFAPTVLGGSSPVQTLTITNSGGSFLDMLPPVLSSAAFVIKTNSCGGVLLAGEQCALGLAFTPSALGDQQAIVTVSANGGAVHAQATLDGTGLAAANLVFTPTTLAFGSVQQGKSSALQTVTLSNTGGVTAVLNLPVLTAQYTLVNNCSATLAPAVTCTLLITFSPTTAGSHPGSLTVSTTDASTSASVTLNGTGTPPPSLVLTPTALVFPTLGQGVTSAAQNITVANIGMAAVTLQPSTITGDFVLSADNCTGTALQPTYSCPLSITFTPTAGGLRTGLLTVTDGAETHTATLTGTGLSPATDTLSTTSLTFGPQVFGTVSPAQSVSMTNSGGSTLGAISTTVTGPFIAANNCGTMLGGGLSCSFSISFSPVGAGAQTGQLTIADSQRSQVVSLSGLGVLPPQAVATPISLDFGGFAVGVPSPVQLVTMTNNGKTSLTSFTAITGTASFSVASNSCGSTIPAGVSCTFGIAFTPQQPGNAVDQLTLSSPSLSDTLSVALSGFGEDFQLSVSGSTSDLITTGQTATYHLIVTPVGSSTGTLILACTGAPANSTCTVNPTTLGIVGGATGSLTVSVATGLSSTAASRPPSDPWKYAATLALLLPCLILRGRTRRTFLALLVTMALVLAPTACGVHASGGSSSGSGGSGAGSTPPGKYAITVSASFPGAQRTAVLTLTVE